MNERTPLVAVVPVQAFAANAAAAAEDEATAATAVAVLAAEENAAKAVAVEDLRGSHRRSRWRRWLWSSYPAFGEGEEQEQRGVDGAGRSSYFANRRIAGAVMVAMAVALVAVVFVVVPRAGNEQDDGDYERDENEHEIREFEREESGAVGAIEDRCCYEFPPDFVWGVATSSYQIEGSYDKGGRGETIWDAFCRLNGTILDGSNGDVACDHYRRYKDDVELMSSLDVRAYRFSIAWSRILPNGTFSGSSSSSAGGGVNRDGIEFYNSLIDTLLQHRIEPWVTMYHWDLPQALQDRYGGWLGRETATAFAEDYARVLFRHFGDRVKRWITINEAWTVAVNG